MFHSPSCLCNACIVGVNAHGFFKSGGSGNLWCIFSIFPVTLFFLPPSVSLPTMHRFTCKLLSVVCGECTKFKHINKHFNFQMVSSLYSRPRLSFSLLPPCPRQTCRDLSPPFCPPSLQREGTWDLQILPTFAERRRRDTKPRLGLLNSMTSSRCSR